MNNYFNLDNYNLNEDDEMQNFSSNFNLEKLPESILNKSDFLRNYYNEEQNREPSSDSLEDDNDILSKLNQLPSEVKNKLYGSMPSLSSVMPKQEGEPDFARMVEENPKPEYEKNRDELEKAKEYIRKIRGEAGQGSPESITKAAEEYVLDQRDYKSRLLQRNAELERIKKQQERQKQQQVLQRQIDDVKKYNERASRFGMPLRPMPEMPEQPQEVATPSIKMEQPTEYPSSIQQEQMGADRSPAATWKWKTNEELQKSAPEDVKQIVGDIFKKHKLNPMITPEVILRFGDWESRGTWNDKAIGKDKDMGIMQVRPVAMQEVNRVYGTNFKEEDLLDKRINLEVGTLYANILAKKASSPFELAAMYNGGPAALNFEAKSKLFGPQKAKQAVMNAAAYANNIFPSEANRKPNAEGEQVEDFNTLMMRNAGLNEQEIELSKEGDRNKIEQYVQNLNDSTDQTAQTAQTFEPLVESLLNKLGGDQRTNYIDLYNKAMDLANKQTFSANLGKALAQISGAGAGLATKSVPKVDTSLFEDIGKDSSKYGEYASTRMKLDEFDPQSSKSKGYAKLLKEQLGSIGISNVNFEGLSYNEMKGIADDLIRLQSKRGEIKKEDEQKIDDFITKETNRIKQTDLYKTSQRIGETDEYLTKALNNPTAVGDIVALYKHISNLDPRSTVREGEVSLMQRALGLYDRLKLKLQDFTLNPRVLTQDVIKDIQEYNDLIKNSVQRRLKDEALTVEKQVRSRAKTAGLSIDVPSKLSGVVPFYKEEQELKYKIPSIDDIKAERKRRLEAGVNPNGSI